jgi:hypothetical protein
MQMKQLLNEWKQYINEQENTLFDKNMAVLKKAYMHDPDVNVEEITPENGKILTQIELGNFVGQGGYGKVYSIADSNMVIKFFESGIDWEHDVHRMNKIADEIFSGKASVGKMHYFETGDAGPLHYVIMPRIIPFERSITYQQDPELFNDVSEAMSMAIYNGTGSYADFRDKFYKELSITIKDWAKFKGERYVDEYIKRLNTLDETIHKLLRIVYKAATEEGGMDLHLGNLGFFPQKPDDWFFFDMF